MSEQPNENTEIPEDEGYEYATVTLENVSWVAERSGRNEQELRAMLMVSEMMKGQPLRVKYKLGAGLVPVEPPKKRFWKRGKK